MFILGNFFIALAKMLDIVLGACVWLIIARAVLSWINPDPYNPIVRFLYRATDPVLLRLRRIIPVIGGFDISPMLLIVALIFLQSFLVPTLQRLGQTLQ